MNPARFLVNFERLVDGPDAIPRLRRFVLDLAVRGKLVQQDPNDEPASELLKRIEAEKTRLAGRMGKQAPFAAVQAGERSFGIPATWAWVPATYPAYGVSDLGKKVQTKDVQKTGAFPVVDQGRALIRGYCDDSEKVIKVDCPLIIFGDHTRETKLVNFDFVVGADGVKLLQPVGVDERFYFLSLRWLPLDSRGYGRHFKLLKASLLPLPPLAEQHRIVAKVDELMALCDRLEAARNERENRRDRLVAASLHRLSQPADEDGGEAFRADIRFYLNHLPRMSTRPDHVKQLRQTILNLAVRGRLVPQDPNDEPASVLLERVSAERAELVAKRAIRREKPVAPVRSDEVPFELPAGWIWSRIGDAVLFTQYGTSQRSQATEAGVSVLTMGNIQNGLVVLGGEKKIPKTSDDLPDLYLKKFDLLYNRTNSAELVGKTGIYMGDANCRTFASYLIRLRLSDPSSFPIYMNLAMNAPVFRETQIVPLIKKQTG